MQVGSKSLPFDLKIEFRKWILKPELKVKGQGLSPERKTSDMLTSLFNFVESENVSLSS